MPGFADSRNLSVERKEHYATARIRFLNTNHQDCDAKKGCGDAAHHCSNARPSARDAKLRRTKAGGYFSASALRVAAFVIDVLGFAFRCFAFNHRNFASQTLFLAFETRCIAFAEWYAASVQRCVASQSGVGEFGQSVRKLANRVGACAGYSAAPDQAPASLANRSAVGPCRTVPAWVSSVALTISSSGSRAISPFFVTWSSRARTFRA